MGDWPPLVNAAVIATCTFVTAIAILFATMASPVGEVEGWSQWRADSGAINLEHPDGWAVRNVGSSEQIHLIILRSPWVRIHVVSESGLADAAAIYRRLGSGGARYEALERLHETVGETWEEQLALGKLEEGRTGHTTIGGRRAVWSQFKYVGDRLEGGEAMTGYRATLIGEDNGVIASAVAPTEHWEEFRPIALHVFKSIRFAEGVR
jgi:hypothetical protein